MGKRKCCTWDVREPSGDWVQVGAVTSVGAALAYAEANAICAALLEVRRANLRIPVKIYCVSVSLVNGRLTGQLLPVRWPIRKYIRKKVRDISEDA